MIDLRFKTGQIVDGRLYFSANEFDGLCEFDFQSKKCTYICSFERGQDFVKQQHGCSFKYENKVGFVPWYGTHLDIYDWDNNSLQSIPLKNYSRERPMFCGCCVVGKYVWLIPIYFAPSSIHQPIVSVDLVSYEYVEHWELNAQIVQGVNRTGEISVLGIATKGTDIYLPIVKEQWIYIIHTLSGTIEKVASPLSSCNRIAFEASGQKMIISSFQENTICTWDMNNHEVECIEAKAVSNRKCSMIIELKNDYLLIPESGDIMYAINKEDKRVKKKTDFCSLFQKNRDDKQRFLDYGVYNNKVVLYPNSYDEMIFIDFDTGEVEEVRIQEFVVSDEYKEVIKWGILSTPIKESVNRQLCEYIRYI